MGRISLFLGAILVVVAGLVWVKYPLHQHAAQDVLDHAFDHQHAVEKTKKEFSEAKQGDLIRLFDPNDRVVAVLRRDDKHVVTTSFLNGDKEFSYEELLDSGAILFRDFGRSQFNPWDNYPSIAARYFQR